MLFFILINPPLRIFGHRIFPEVFIILQKSWQNFLWLLLFSKKFRLRRALIIIFFSEGRFWAPWGSIFKRNYRFCLKIAPKKFRLRRAGGPRFLLFFKKFRLRRALIIFRFPKFSCFYYFLKILAKCSLALIIRFLRGVLIINTPVWCYIIPSSELIRTQKTPEMNVSERDKKSLKI